MREVLVSTDFILGKAVGRFETHFAEYLGCRRAIGVGSGTEALILALRAAGLKPGDEVITAANTYIATVLAISQCGATPVLADARADDFNIDPEAVREALTERTRALVPVHLCGQPARMDELLGIAREHDLVVIEDACQAHGARYDGTRTGTMGDMGCFSFYPSKNLGGFGDGGMVVTNRTELADAAGLLRNYGQQTKNIHEIKGINSRLDSIQAAVLDVKLPHLDEWNTARRRAAGLYRELLRDLPVKMQEGEGNSENVYHLFVILTAERDGLMAYLRTHEIDSAVHYPTPIHLQPAYADLGRGAGSYPVAEKLAASCLSLPMYPEISDAQVRRVCRVISDYFEGV
ncbi:DegT/DnrJ/EryC1/StrS family aminotransferase [bacterium]|nr:DegT/DnrJ/EryC1/StrS family aminotransferase [candidate division CSSED10-310 bacterium]